MTTSGNGWFFRCTFPTATTIDHPLSSDFFLCITLLLHMHSNSYSRLFAPFSIFFLCFISLDVREMENTLHRVALQLPGDVSSWHRGTAFWHTCNHAYNTPWAQSAHIQYTGKTRLHWVGFWGQKELFALPSIAAKNQLPLRSENWLISACSDRLVTDFLLHNF